MEGFSLIFSFDFFALSMLSQGLNKSCFIPGLLIYQLLSRLNNFFLFLIHICYLILITCTRLYIF